MGIVGQKERRTQDRIVGLFRERLQYQYLGNWEERPDNRNIEEGLLQDFLIQQKVSDELIHKALYELNKAAGDQSRDLYYINKDVYNLLRYGVQVQPEAGMNNQTVWLIDWDNPLNNHFAIAEEVTVTGQHTKRPDIVLYVNGIALGVLELKRSTVSVSEGIRQNLDNQKKIFIQGFFSTIQLVMAGNDTEGLRYGTIETPEKYYLAWKEDSSIENPLDRALTQLCQKERLLEIIHGFIVFDAGTKKVCRHNQYFGVKAAQQRLRTREGGIIWHTQGSGKSLTMVWLARWIRENIKNARVLIITDRIELDEQIEGKFSGAGEQIYRTKSGRDLVDCLNAALPWLMCSLIHKFAGREESDVEGYIEELKRSLPKDFKAKGDIYVFVDECHRTQSGELHKAMKSILPNAVFIGFTGTPLLKADKQKSIEVFGSYIHTYKYDEAVRDKVVLDLRYEARDIEQAITSQAKIDQWFDLKTRGLSDVARAQLKQRWGTMQTVLSAQSRLEKIVADILLDFETRDRLQNGTGNALLVSGSIYQACKFYELFTSQGFHKCAIITSYRPNSSDIKGEETGEGLTERLRQYDIYDRMLNGKDVEVFEKEVKDKFIHEPGQMKLLIVVDKLLTGFDAPPATYLYIDKQMRDHGLFQAICRVNRLDTDDKEYGYIIDYKDLFQSLEGAVTDYTSGAFDAYDKEDVLGLLTNRLDKAKERLEEAREAIKALCEPVDPPKDSAAYIRYFCAKDTADKDALKDNEPKRIALYKLTVSLIRAYANIANELPDAGYSAPEIETIKHEVEYFENVRSEIKLASGDYIDLKMYEPAMRHLIDTYIHADESRKISAFDDMTLIQLIVERGPQAVDQLPPGIASSQDAAAETIENNLRRVIIDERPINPRYYERMSELLDNLIKERKEQARQYEEYLKKLVELTKQVVNPNVATYPKKLNTAARRALYDNLGKNEELAIALDQEILATRKDDWRGHVIKERQIRYVISQHVPDEAEAERIFELVKNQRGY
ncbi:MAG: type I restriction endonuclease subunit R [Anaerolineales bacterium]|nr:type I restriction endonuclease subunit R [Anaerolineales bacterium]